MRGKPKKLGSEALWDYALRALGQRSHSSSEIKQKIARRAETPTDIDAVMAKLREYGLADDKKFSETYAAGRLQSQGFGKFRVLRDLRAKRVSQNVAEQALEKTFAGTDEQQLAEEFLQRKYRGKDLTEFLKEEKNLAAAYRRLRTAGFGGVVSLMVLKRHSSHARDWNEEIDEDTEG